MANLTFTNKAKIANFTFIDEEYTLTGVVRTDGNDTIMAIEGGTIAKNELICGNFYAYKEGDTLKTNVNGIDAPELSAVGVVINACLEAVVAGE